MAFLYSDMTAEQKQLFDQVVSTEEMIRAARNGIGLDKLAQSNNRTVRINVAMNEETPVEFLEKLLNDDEFYVVSAAIKNPKTPTEAIIAKLNAPDARRTLFTDAALNKKIDDTVAQTIIDRGDTNAISVLARNSSLSVAQIEMLYGLGSYDSSLASNPATPIEIKNKLAFSTSKDARLNVATCPDLSEDALLHLAVDEKLEVRLNLAGNKRLPESVQRILAEDEADNVVQKIAANPTTSSAVLDEITARALIPTEDEEQYDKRLLLTTLADNPSISGEALRSMIEQRGNLVFSEAAKNPATPPEVLEVIYFWDSERGKTKVLSNPNVPDYLIRKAVLDPRQSLSVHAAALQAAHRAGLEDVYNVKLPVDELVAIARSEQRAFPRPDEFIIQKLELGQMHYQWCPPNSPLNIEIEEDPQLGGDAWVVHVSYKDVAKECLATSLEEAYTQAYGLYNLCNIAQGPNNKQEPASLPELEKAASELFEKPQMRQESEKARTMEQPAVQLNKGITK